MAETDPALIGMESCGCVTYANAAPQHLDRADERAIARITRAGGQLLRMTVGEARALPHFLVSECPHDPKGWEREPYVPPSERISIKFPSRGRAAVYRGYTRIGHVKRATPRAGAWYATPGHFSHHADAETRDGAELLGPFPSRQAAVDALAAPALSEERA